jgi:thiol-disulfide isomerase/thioredoxin
MTDLRRTFWKWIVIPSFCLIWVSFFSYCEKAKKDQIQTYAPDFTLKTLDGQEITLSHLKGKAILLDFWATWCGPCRESIPHLVQLYKTYQERGFEVIGLNMDKGNINAVRQFVKSMDIPYSIAVAPDDLVRKYGVTSLPTTILIDRAGKIQGKLVGFNNTIAKQMVAKMTDLISEKP